MQFVLVDNSCLSNSVFLSPVCKSLFCSLRDRIVTLHIKQVIHSHTTQRKRILCNFLIHSAGRFQTIVSGSGSKAVGCLFGIALFRFSRLEKRAPGESVENSSPLTELLSGWLRVHEGAARRVSDQLVPSVSTGRQVAPAADSIANNYC